MELIELLKALTLGFVEGLTEFLPVSSTGHLIVLGKLLGFDDPGGAFKVMIQLGAILAVVIVFFRRIWDTVIGLPTKAEARQFAAKIVLAFIPAAIAGVLLADTVEKIFFESPHIVATALISGGIVMLAVERWRHAVAHADVDAIPIWKSFVIGCCQACALIPGVSRSGATIVGAMLLGVERRAGAEFSFFLAMPTMLGAFTYSFLRNRDQMSFDDAALIGAGFIAAFIAGFFVVRIFLDIVSKYGFAPFAWYRIVFGGLILAMFGWPA